MAKSGADERWPTVAFWPRRSKAEAVFWINRRSLTGFITLLALVLLWYLLTDVTGVADRQRVPSPTEIIELGGADPVRRLCRRHAVGAGVSQRAPGLPGLSRSCRDRGALGPCYGSEPAFRGVGEPGFSVGAAHPTVGLDSTRHRLVRPR